MALLSIDLLSKFNEKRVLVIGDVMLDEFVRGNVARISPEAPIPVLEVVESSHRPGGAANAAANVRSLGGQVCIIGVVGDDDGAALLQQLLEAGGIEAKLVSDDRPTTRKTRYLARGQQMMRIDREARQPPSDHAKRELLNAIIGEAAGADAIVISDYAKGVVTDDMVAEVVRLASFRKTPVVADPKYFDFRRYRGVSLITPNSVEIEIANGAPIRTARDLETAAWKLVEVLGGASLLATRGGEGMVLFEPEREPVRVRPHAKSVYDVTGAGDTVVATLALALSASAPLRDAVVLSSLAAGVAVCGAGTVAVTSDELAQAIREELGTGGRLDVSVFPRGSLILGLS
jgi:D-beta-D-heptose 7-phosphate kinase/D-beta-D-heptose 1-phosphate adenosyltransferase